ncbi:hypothetical protein CL643_02005 [bacterium]|nr:hypothetical protein [bacterium]|tara:strand:+ start:2965 stop:3711 length:747 start_codon:yes stop_codon:yes gene_type:complete
MNLKIQGKGQPLLLIPGLGGCSKSFDYLIPHLDKLQVITFDPLGCGSSMPIDKASPNVIFSSIVSLIKDLKFEKINVLGTSFGGVIARMLAVENNDLIDRLILVATEPNPDRSVRPKNQKPRVGKSATARERTKAWLKSFSFKGWESEDNFSFTAAVKYYSNNEPLSETQRLQRDFVLKNRNFGMPENIKQKTLIVHGDHDSLVPFENAEILHNLIFRSELKKIESCGHMIAWEKSRELSILIKEFFK